jgi:hypothetical protein
MIYRLLNLGLTSKVLKHLSEHWIAPLLSPRITLSGSAKTLFALFLLENARLRSRITALDIQEKQLSWKQTHQIWCAVAISLAADSQGQTFWSLKQARWSKKQVGGQTRNPTWHLGPQHISSSFFVCTFLIQQMQWCKLLLVHWKENVSMWTGRFG